MKRVYAVGLYGAHIPDPLGRMFSDIRTAVGIIFDAARRSEIGVKSKDYYIGEWGKPANEIKVRQMQ
ncbi:hypothetical protein W02_07610 [Nitrospira sp. KM1]|uniref:hypothetical protein n=1 Tax=Nitrospira sp. KM1 TaxID=1936990 RepID=UPI0013A71FE9|nr:hypothetical protein [Nitrospira sp. KM1]BCA53621.1 hypothetical protein W02_07610 [Nitrospira sp. KM1]